MIQKIKDQFANIRRHYKLFALLIILMCLCYRMFISNYKLVNPVIKIDNYQAQQQTQTDLAACLSTQAISANDTNIQANNLDLYK